MKLEILREDLLRRERFSFDIPEFKRAAVLVGLTLETDPKVILTERGSHLPTHKGQIAFPGGKLEPNEDAVQAALREAHEEIGLEPSAVEVLGLLHDVWTPQGFQVTPVLGFVPSDAMLQPNPGEVAQLLLVPLSELRALEPRAELRHQPPLGRWPPGVQGPRAVLHYDWRGVDIWGMTAFVIRDLLERLSGLPSSGM